MTDLDDDQSNDPILNKLLGVALLFTKTDPAEVRKSAIKLKKGAPASMINGALDPIINNRKQYKSILREYFSKVDDYTTAIQEILAIDNPAIGGMLVYDNTVYPISFDMLASPGETLSRELEVKLVKFAAMAFARAHRLQKASVRITLFSDRGFSGDAYPASVIIKDHELDDEHDKELIQYLKEHRPDDICHHSYD